MKTWFPIVSTGLAVFFMVMTSCGPAAKLRRAEKLINKAEEMGARWHVDTIYVTDTLIFHSVKADTVTLIKPGDTVVLEKERLRVSVVRLRGDSIFVQGECLPDTVIKKVPVTVVKTIKAKGGIKWWWLVVALAVGTFLGRFVIKALLG